MRILEESECILAKVPQQQNGYDCGIFVCGFMTDIFDDTSIHHDKLLFQQKDCLQMREYLRNLIKFG